ncbi:low temperature requirement protein A [Rugosimonospora africana]|uniref:Uncharacterized protein n=1 Tax=Rugosimonospora africana TaxID=556532 RepID=A0A8J3QZ96_9ACTN|nr:low temperature requirement protein A [Rugosimonospora africana]GIH18892.1 hypothetical protein Raf01_70640 [Rugosimonospora africana]
MPSWSSSNRSSTAPRWLIAILGGPALFLFGRAPFEREVFGRISRSRVVGVLVLGLLAAAMWHLPPLAADAAAVAALATVAGVDTRRTHARGARPPATRL